MSSRLDAVRALLGRIARHAERGNTNSVAYLTAEAIRILDEPPKSLTVVVALPDRALCGNGRAHGFERSELVKEARAAALVAGAAAHREAVGVLSDAELADREPYFGSGRVAVRVHAKRDPLWSARALDDDNMQRGLKPVWDAFASAKIVANDRQFYYDGEVEWSLGEPYRGDVTLTLVADD